MKKAILLLTLICFSLFAKAQTTTYNPAYFGIGGFKDSKGVSGNLTFELHSDPKTADNFSFGVKFQFAVTPIAGYSSVCLTSDYYLLRPGNGLRVFVGAGLGDFDELTGGTGISDNFLNLNSKPNFGFFPRIGIEAGRFRLSAEYDFTGGTDNYYAINLGFFFGGRRKK